MKPLYIFRHVACEGPAYLAQVLERHGIPWQSINIDAGAEVPASVDDSAGLVFMGGPMSVNDDLPWIAQELELIRTAHERGLPVLGHCLGGQLISKALGGTVAPGAVKEIGWLPVQATDTPVARDWLDDLPNEFTVFHWHGEMFSIPDGAELILRSARCPHQAFVSGNTLALQFHVEMQAPMVSEWAGLYQHEIAQPSATIQSLAEMTSDLGARIAAAQQVADRLYGKWLSAVAG